MKKLLCLLSVTICILIGTITPSYSENNYNARTITLAKGSFLRAVMQREVSTATNKLGDEVRMIASSPTFAADGLVVPERTIYIGKIIEINQPIEGCNGSLRIKIEKMIFPSGDEMEIEAMLFSNRKNLFGGELTPPAYYQKIPHYTFRWGGGCLAFQDSGIYQVGKPTIIKAGTELLIVLEQDTDFFPYEL